MMSGDMDTADSRQEYRVTGRHSNRVHNVHTCLPQCCGRIAAKQSTSERLKTCISMYSGISGLRMFFKKKTSKWRIINPFCRATCKPSFGLLVSSALGIKTMVVPWFLSFACFVACLRCGFPQIHRLCHTCRTLGSLHGSRAVNFFWGGGRELALKLVFKPTVLWLILFTQWRIKTKM